MKYIDLSEAVEQPAPDETRARRFRVSCDKIEVILACLDVFVTFFASVFVAAIFQFLWFGVSSESTFNFATSACASLLYVYVVASCGFYRFPILLSPLQYLARTLVPCIIINLLVMSILFFLKSNPADISEWKIPFVVLPIPLLRLTRWFGKTMTTSMMRTKRLAGRSVVTLGEPEELLRLSKAAIFCYFGFKEVTRISIGANKGRLPNDALTELNRAIDAARKHGAEEIVVAVRWDRKELINTVRAHLRQLPLSVHLLPDQSIRSAFNERRAFTTNWTTLIVELQRAPLTPMEKNLKRALDIILASTVIVLLLPLLALTAIIIKLDSPGPIIFRQRRNGFNQKIFVIFKFRTMTVQEDGPTIKQARRSDDRVTRVGKILRRSSIDELPQLFNVLLGEMSLVGPRPHALAHDKQYKDQIEKYTLRDHVKPGLTGWAQINGLRGETEHLDQMAKRVEFDLWYINHWSIGLDLIILLRTCFEVLRKPGF